MEIMSVVSCVKAQWHLLLGLTSFKPMLHRTAALGARSIVPVAISVDHVYCPAK